MTQQLAVNWLHLGVLWAFAMAQPLFGVLSDSPEFFVARDNTSGDIVLLAFVLALMPPTLLLLLELPFWRAPALRRMVHLALVASLAALLAIQALKSIVDADAVILIPAAILIGAAASAVYARVPTVRSVLTALAPAPLVFPALFLLASGVSKLVLPEDDAEAVGPSRTDIPIVMVVMDEFASTALLDKRQRIDAARFPNFGKLAASSTWYRNATTVADFTPVAVPAILTGKRVKPGTVPIASEQPDNVFTFLGPGHAMNVEEPVTALCPESLCRRARDPTVDRWSSLVSDLSVVAAHRVAPRDLESDLPVVDQSFEGFGETGDDGKAAEVRKAAGGDVPFSTLQDRPAAFARFLSRVGSGRGPGFDFLHIALPHIPWEFLPTGQQYGVTGPEAPGLSDDTWEDDPELTQQAEQRYLLQVGFMDRLLGRLIARMRHEGLWERALFVVTADHGVSFKPGAGRRRVSEANLGEIAPIPLFIREPGQSEGRIEDEPIRSVDILPKMAEILDLRLPWDPEAPSDRVDVNGATASYKDFAKLRQAVLDRQHGLFGEGRAGLYRLGMRDLRPSELESGVSVKLDGDYGSVNPSGSLVPAFVTGQLSADAFDHVAIALNGRTAAVAPTYRAGATRFSAVISPTLLRRGRNRVEVFGIQGNRLVAMKQRASQTYRLEEGAIKSSEGATIEISGGGVDGYVDTSGFEDGRLRVAGWAVSDGRPVERIVVFAHGEFVASTEPTVERPDVAENHGRGALQSGYQVAAPLDGDPEAVQVFAVVGGRAVELPRSQP